MMTTTIEKEEDDEFWDNLNKQKILELKQKIRTELNGPIGATFVGLILIGIYEVPIIYSHILKIISIMQGNSIEYNLYFVLIHIILYLGWAFLIGGFIWATSILTSFHKK